MDGGTNRHGLSFRHPQLSNALAARRAARPTRRPRRRSSKAARAAGPGTELAAELTLSIPTGAADTSSKTIGVPIEANASVFVDARESRPTHVVAVSMNSRGSLDDNMPYGVGENFYVDVQFSDEVKLSGVLPTFYLSTGAYALFDTGENTDTLTFFYRPAAGETTSSLDWAPVPDNTQFGAPVYSAIYCNASAGCELTDIQNVAVNYTMNTSATPAEGGRVLTGGDVEVVVPHMNTGIQISDARRA